MKRGGTFLIWLACGLVFCAVSRANPAMPGSIPPRAYPGFNADEFRKMTPQERAEYIQKLKAKGPGARPLASSPMLPPARFVPVMAIPPQGMPGSGMVSTNIARPSVEAGNPYGSIVVRNVFGLNPIPPHDPTTDQERNPPPKITLTGITTIFGPAEALFKVAGGNRDGKQWPDQSYILQEDEAQDDVEVTKIDTEKDIVTFKNHGEEQVIPLANGVASGGPPPSAPSFTRPQPHFGGRFNVNNLPPKAREILQQRYGNAIYNSDFNPSTSGQYNYNGASSSGSGSSSQLSGDDTMAITAAQHAQYDQSGDPRGPIMPPTPYDDEAHKETGGSPPAP